ncbi:MAG: hypothetical protein Cons2KO_04590 [Congregibacter sp.]
MNTDLQTALAACKTLPTLPNVAAQIIDLASQDDYGLSDIIDIVRNDITIAAKLIASANTPQYWRGQAVVDVAQAVSRLGFKSTMMIALSFSLSVKTKNNQTPVDTNALWHRSVASAAIARLLARQLDSKDAEGCFLAALVQDIGVLALCQAAPDTYNSLASPSHEALCAAEIEAFGADHAAVGAWLLEQWKLPKQIIDLVSTSHEFAALTLDNDSRKDHWCVAISGLLADAMLAGDQFQAARMVWLIDGMCNKDARDRESNIVHLIAEAVREAEMLFEAQLVPEPVTLLEASKEKLFEVMTQASRDVEEEKIVKLEERVSMLERQGQLDSLTGAVNRGHFHSELDQQFEVAGNSGEPLSLMFIDADHFKQVNDTYGHLAGDEVLKWLANLFQGTVRDNDLVARYGGEEFVVILPGMSEADTKAMGQSICAAVREGAVHYEGTSIKVTVSIGIATVDKTSPMRSTRDLIFAADQAMYFAKQSGRDLCIRASALPKPPFSLAAAG